MSKWKHIDLESTNISSFGKSPELQVYVVIDWQVFLGSSTCSAERETGPSLGWTGGEVFWVGTLEGACGCDWCEGAAAGIVSGVPFSGILCKMKSAVTSVREVRCRDRDLYNAFDLVSCFHFVDGLTLFGVWMGDRASRSVMGNSRPRLLKSSYTYTTPAREGELRNASAHDCEWEGEHMTKYDENDWLRCQCSITQYTGKERTTEKKWSFNIYKPDSIYVINSARVHTTGFDHAT